MTQADQPVGRIPSLATSLLVLGVMVGLILYSVMLFGNEVAAGPLQVSMTLATLFALAVAYMHGHGGALISTAIGRNVNAALGTIFILIAVGAVIGALYLSGTVAAFVYYGVKFLNPTYFYVTVFILASALSVLTGSSFTTIGAIGVAFVGLATLLGVSVPITAGAAVSGAFLGDKVARISDTLVLTAAVVGGVTTDEHARSVFRTARIPWVISAVLYLILGFTVSQAETVGDLSLVQESIESAFHMSPLAFLPVVMIFVFSSLRLSAFVSLMLAALVGVILSAFTQPGLITRIADNPDLSYFGQVVTVGISTFAHGFQLDSGSEQMDKLFSGGGTWGMFETVWLILVACAFGAIVDHTGIIQRIIAPVVRWSSTSLRLVIATSFSCIGLNVFTADPYVSIVLGGKMFRDEYMKRNLKPVFLSTTIADSGSMFSPLVPWNVHGAFVAGAMGVAVTEYAPYAFMCYLSVMVTTILARRGLREARLPTGSDAALIYGAEPEELPEPKQSA